MNIGLILMRNEEVQKTNTVIKRWNGAFVKINFGNGVNAQWIFVQVLELNIVNSPLQDGTTLPLYVHAYVST